MIDLKGSTVLCTGGSSMIGSVVCETLFNRGAYVLAPTHTQYDLLSSADTYAMFEKYHPDYVVHCAGFNGGIEYNRKYPASIFYKTSLIALNVLTFAQLCGVKKVVSLISSC